MQARRAGKRVSSVTAAVKAMKYVEAPVPAI
jgi:hypothetical protein